MSNVDPPSPVFVWGPTSDWIQSNNYDFYEYYTCPDCLSLVSNNKQAIEDHKQCHAAMRKQIAGTNLEDIHQIALQRLEDAQQQKLDDIHPSLEPEDSRLHWIGRFTDVNACVWACEADLADGVILNYKIVKRSDGNVDVYETWSPDVTYAK